MESMDRGQSGDVELDTGLNGGYEGLSRHYTALRRQNEGRPPNENFYCESTSVGYEIPNSVRTDGAEGVGQTEDSRPPSGQDNMLNSTSVRNNVPLYMDIIDDYDSIPDDHVRQSHQGSSQHVGQENTLSVDQEQTKAGGENDSSEPSAQHRVYKHRWVLVLVILVLILLIIIGVILYFSISRGAFTEKCVSGTCLNGGTCTDTSGGPSCKCAAGFEGNRCETRQVENCVSGTCLNGGTCTDTSGGPSCECAAGFEGNRCETRQEKCVSGTCLNGGTCTDTSGGPSCKCAAGFEGNRCETKQESDCSDVLKDNPSAPSGLYDVYIPGSTQPTKVSCDKNTAGGPWLVFQRRTDGSEMFYRAWNEYKTGFGDVANEFWLGNDKISALTNSRRYRLRIDMEDWEGTKRYAAYNEFKLGDESTSYTLHLGNYSGDVVDSLTYHNGHMFSTYDRDNDIWDEGNCAASSRGAWWYNLCHASNLNGDYNNTAYGEGIDWAYWPWRYDPQIHLGDENGPYFSLRFTEMKITVV